MPLLYYWRRDNYQRDRRFGFGYHLNQNSPAMATAQPGEILWAFTRRRMDRLYVLAAELVVRAVTRNSPNFRYGAYRTWSDLDRTRYFDTDSAPNAEPLIRRMSVPANARVLGRSFQGHAAVRRLTSADHQLLSRFASDLPVLQQVGVFGEDEFEARLVLGEGEDIGSRVFDETRHARNQRLAYLYETVDVARARSHVRQLHRIYGGRCQICLFDPRKRYTNDLCHGHHIQWLSRGGDDELENMALVCPNHHAAIHKADAVFDFSTLAFRFENGLIERLRLNRHLPVAA